MGDVLAGPSAEQIEHLFDQLEKVSNTVTPNVLSDQQQLLELALVFNDNTTMK